MSYPVEQPADQWVDQSAKTTAIASAIVFVASLIVGAPAHIAAFASLITFVLLSILYGVLILSLTRQT